MRFFLVPLAVAVLVVPARAADDLDLKLRDHAPKIIEYLQNKKCDNVGVLKFLVDPGDGQVSDNAGELNLGLANRLEVALVLGLKDDALGVIQQATEVAAKIRGANHTTATGRQRCFRSNEYRLAWGDPQHRVKPDIFLTGIAVLAKDLKSTTIHIQAFGRDGKLDENVCEFTAKTGIRTLADAGHTYLLTPKSHPDLFKGARGFDEEELAKPAVDMSKQFQTSTPAKPGDPAKPPKPAPIESNAPIRVTIYYNDRPVEVKDGRVQEPGPNDKVWFELENRSDAVHGVVLKVNGENTLFRERLDDRDCFKWILKPGDKIQVRGFQTNPREREEFVVLPPEAGGADEVRYGPLLGLFQVAAFRGALTDKDGEPAVIPTEEKQTLAAIARGALILRGIPPGSLAALQADLRGREKITEGSKGIVDADAANPKPHPVEKVIFKPDPPIPIMLYQIQYYQPKHSK